MVKTETSALCYEKYMRCHSYMRVNNGNLGWDLRFPVNVKYDMNVINKIL